MSLQVDDQVSCDARGNASTDTRVEEASEFVSEVCCYMFKA
jgi:hypothetical protein